MKQAFDGYNANRPIAYSSGFNKPANRPNSPIAQTNTKARVLSDEDADYILDLYKHLYTPAYRPKYFWALQRIGADQFISLATRAEGGKQPQHLFRYLIDKA